MLACVIPRGIEPSGGGVVSGLRGTLDFVNGVYNLDGVTLTPETVTEHPDRITASGLQSTDFPDYNDGNSTDLIGTFRSALLTGEFTIVMEWEELYDEGTTIPLCIHSALGGGVYQDIFQVQRYQAGSSEHGLIFDKSDNDIVTQRDIDTAGTSPVISNLGIGTHKIAITRTADKLVASINGSVLLEPTGGYSGSQTGFGADLVAVGGFSADFAFNDCYLRSLLLYTEQDDSELPTLST